MLSSKQQLDNAVTLISTLQGANFYGQCILDMHNGNITIIRLHQTIKLEEHNGSKKGG